MRKKKKKEYKSLDEIEVKLKKIGNIRPGVYLTILYAFIVVLIVFFVFFLPGLRKPGSILSFTTIPESAAVYIDGEYAGTTPCEIFVSKGKHTFTIGKLGFRDLKTEVSVPGRLFAGLIFPKEVSISRRLEMETPESYLDTVLEDFAGWSSIDSFHYRYQPVSSLSNALETIYYGNYPVSSGLIDDFLIEAMPYSSDEALLKDFIRAYSLSKTEGAALSPSTFLETVGSLLAAQERYPKLPFWTAGQLSSQTAEPLIGSGWYESVREEYMDLLQHHPDPAAGALLEDTQVIDVEGINFVFIPGGSYRLGSSDQDSFPVMYTAAPFYVGGREISYRQFSRFLDENPKYRPSNKEQLVEEGLVTEDYLKDWDMNKESTLPVAFVSFYAADAYCRWLETKLPDFVSNDFTVALPNEYQWECAAAYSYRDDAVLHDENDPGPKSVNRSEEHLLSDFYGNVWEWCGNWYKNADFIMIGKDGIRQTPDTQFSKVEKSVRGGSWAVMEDLVSITSRGGQPPEWCTPFLGFRPAILQK